MVIAAALMSHLTQVSGLKYLMQNGELGDTRVSPYTGEWIEISSEPAPSEMPASVSPYTGEWIEISANSLSVFCLPVVSPYTGEWIEIALSGPKITMSSSLTLHR